MKCLMCETEYRLSEDGESGYVRSLCPCEGGSQCDKCKRGQKKPANQARLALDYSVRARTCVQHGAIEAEEYPEPPPKPVGYKEPKKPRPEKERAPIEALGPPEKKPPTVFESNAPVMELSHGLRLKPDPGRHQHLVDLHKQLGQTGPFYYEHGWVGSKKDIAKEFKAYDHSVRCLRCKHEHHYSKRTQEFNDSKSRMITACPECQYLGFEHIS